MATRTNPLVSAAVLASAAAIAVASPAIMPSVHLPSPHALAAAKVQLTTFADVLSITAADYSETLFNGWGEAISPNQDLNIDWAAQFVGQNLRCDFSCKVNGPSGVVYMVLDALINGNGAGIANVGGILQNPNLPYQPDPSKPKYNPYTTPPWGVSSVNYFFEGGAGPGAQYLLSQPFGDPSSPLYNPTVATVINQVFQGADNVTVFYVDALNSISLLAAQIPAVGQYVYGGIQAYLGASGYPQGLSGILKYVIDVVANGGANPIPVPVTGSGASVATLAAAAAPAAPAPVAEAPKVEAAPESAAKVSAPAVSEAKVSAPADTKPEAAPAVSAVEVSDSKPEVKVSAPAAVDTPSAPASTSAPEVKVPEAPAVEDVKPSTPVADSVPEAPKVSTTDLDKEIAKAEKEIAKAENAEASSASSAGGASESKATASDAKASKSEATSGASEAKAGASDAGSSEAGSAKDSGDSAK